MDAITVVTASVNRVGLMRAAESVQAQTLKPAKHCILLQQLMREPMVQLSRPPSIPMEIKWLPPPQPNIVEAYNMADAMADTPLVAMLDDDCWWEPNHLEILAKLMEETGADFVWASTLLEHEDTGEIVDLRDDPLPEFSHIDTNEILFKRSCIERWGGFRTDDADPAQLPLLRGIDGKRIERWVTAGAKYAHSSEYTVHYGWREQAEF